MLKKFLLVIVLMLFSTNNFCNAEMPRKEMYLGGLTFGSSTVQMLRMYGNPSKTEGGIEHLYTCHYGDTVTIGYNSYANKLFEIVVTENNGWHTPKGLSVGMTLDKMLELYGESDFVQSGADKSVYAYFHSNGKENDYGLIILVDDATSKILRMELFGGNTMAMFEDIFPNRVERLLYGDENIPTENVE